MFRRKTKCECGCKEKTFILVPLPNDMVDLILKCTKCGKYREPTCKETVDCCGEEVDERFFNSVDSSMFVNS